MPEQAPKPAVQSNRFRPGIVFKNGKLLQFEPYALTVMQPWPKPLAWRRTTRRPFSPVRPKICLIPNLADEISNGIAEREIAARREFMASVPPDLLTKIEMFHERQWHIMALLARCPGAGDLVHSTPALAFALASNWVFLDKPTTQPMRTARSLSRKKQTAICERLSFPPRASSINMLRKLNPSHISIRTLLDLRDALHEEESAALLRHLPSLSRYAIAVSRHRGWRPYCSSKFLTELSQLSDESAKEALNNIRYILQPSSRWCACKTVFHSAVQINTLMQERARAEMHRSACPSEAVFPAPPLAGTDSIIPLTTGHALLGEAHEMLHCIAEYAEYAMDGGMALYSVLAPERATVALLKDDGVWRLAQIAGPRNAKVSQETYSAVYGWLASLNNASRSERCI